MELTEMITKRYAHILDEDRETLASKIDKSFYQNRGSLDNSTDSYQNTSENMDINSIASLLVSNPELLTKVLSSIRSANKD